MSYLTTVYQLRQLFTTGFDMVENTVCYFFIVFKGTVSNDEFIQSHTKDDS
jgi:hypothetical protein